MNNECASAVVWRRLRYMLSPQFDLYESIAKKLGAMKRPPTVLEVGFGTGAGVVQYAPFVARVDAIEVDEEAVKFAEKCFPLPNVNWELRSITDGVPKDAYEIVVMVETLEHIRKWPKALDNIYDALVYGGELIMTARNANADLRRESQYHEREWTAQELTYALGKWFDDIWLYDWTLLNLQSSETTITPLISVARKS